MLIRFAIIMFAVLASAPLRAQPVELIAAEEWREVLAGVTTDDDDSVLKVATRHSVESTTLLNAGNRSAALHDSVIALVLTRHVFERKERKGTPVANQDVAAVNGLQTALVAAGMSPGVMRRSAANLGVILGEAPTTMVIKSRPAQRPATAAERAAMTTVIRGRLIDPTSPIFGRADIVGNQACFTVNARNRLGAYTGNREAVLYLNPKTHTWTGGGMIDYPHGVCLDTIH